MFTYEGFFCYSFTICLEKTKLQENLNIKICKIWDWFEEKGKLVFLTCPLYIIGKDDEISIHVLWKITVYLYLFCFIHPHPSKKLWTTTHMMCHIEGYFILTSFVSLCHYFTCLTLKLSEFKLIQIFEFEMIISESKIKLFWFQRCLCNLHTKSLISISGYIS